VATARAARPLALVLTLAAAAAAALVPSAASSAAPRATLGQVEARVNALNAEAERITESYDSARDALATLEQQRQVAADQLARDQATLAAARKVISATANYAYQSGGLGGALSLTDMSDPDAFLSSSAMLDEVARYQASQVALVAAAQHDVASASTQVIAKEQAAKKAVDNSLPIAQVVRVRHALQVSSRCANGWKSRNPDTTTGGLGRRVRPQKDTSCSKSRSRHYLTRITGNTVTGACMRPWSAAASR